MAKKMTLFSNKGFYLGVAIFVLGLSIMIARVLVEVNSYSNNAETKAELKIEDKISANIDKLQQQLDEKIKQQETIDAPTFNKTIKHGQLEVFDHNPTKNKDGIITVVEFIDYGCPTCLVDANFAYRILKDNQNIKLISKLNNSVDNQTLHIANLAALIAAKQNKYFEFKEQQLLNPNNDLNQIISNLENAGVSLREFRKELSDNTNTLLTDLSLDINQANKLDVKSYSVFINDTLFSDSKDAPYNLKDITVYLNNL